MAAIFLNSQLLLSDWALVTPPRSGRRRTRTAAAVRAMHVNRDNGSITNTKEEAGPSSSSSSSSSFLQDQKIPSKNLSLEELDEQLTFLSQRTTPSLPPPAVLPDQERADENRVEWPEISDGFLVFLGIALLLITVINNLLFFQFVKIPADKAEQEKAEREKAQQLSSITGLSTQRPGVSDIKDAPQLNRP